MAVQALPLQGFVRVLRAQHPAPPTWSGRELCSVFHALRVEAMPCSSLNAVTLPLTPRHPARARELQANRNELHLIPFASPLCSFFSSLSEVYVKKDQTHLGGNIDSLSSYLGPRAHFLTSLRLSGPNNLGIVVKSVRRLAQSLARSRRTINVSLLPPLSKGESSTGTRPGYITAPSPSPGADQAPSGFAFQLGNANSFSSSLESVIRT